MRIRLIVSMTVAVLSIATAGSAHAGTDADDVRGVLDGMNDAYNRFDFDAFATHLCVAMLRADGFRAGWYESRRTDGPTRIVVNSVDVKGDPAALAVANVRFEAVNQEQPKTLDVDFVREHAEWKACRYHAGQTV